MRAPTGGPLLGTRLAPLLLLLATGCQPTSGPLWIAPLDGASDLALRAPLRARVGDLHLPADPSLPPDLLQVIDLQDGGFVPGVVDYDGESLWFHPGDAWLPERDYLWVVAQPQARAREPVVALPEGVLGEAGFSTRRAPTLLDGVVDDGALCLLYSAPIDPSPPPDVTLGDEPLADAAWDELADPPLPEGVDPDAVSSPSVLCAQGDFSRALGQTLRWTAPDGGSVSFPLARGLVSQQLEQRYRWQEAR